MRALVTGGSRGLGRAVAERLRGSGWDVLAPSRAELDLADPASIAAYCAAMTDPLDAVVHSAGVNWPRAVVQLDFALWNTTLQVNLTAAAQLISGLLPRIRGARVVALGSVLGMVSRPGRAAYSSSKAALSGLVRSLAVELGHDGVLVNAVCPGYIDTDLTRANNTPAQLEAIAATIPLGRLGQPDEIAALVYWLCSAENTYLTGQSIIVDGGFTCQ